MLIKPTLIGNGFISVGSIWCIKSPLAMALCCASIFLFKAAFAQETNTPQTAESASEIAIPPGDNADGNERRIICIRADYNNNFYYFYSENYAKTWVTDGACDSGNNTPVAVESLTVGYRYKGQSLLSKACSSTSECDFSERWYGTGKEIECAAGWFWHGSSQGSATTDMVDCPATLTPQPEQPQVGNQMNWLPAVTHLLLR